MKVAVLGITGRAGSRIAAELLRRGHQVTGIARKVVEVAPRADLTVQAADVRDAEALAPLLRGHDAGISATRFVGGLYSSKALSARLNKTAVSAPAHRVRPILHVASDSESRHAPRFKRFEMCGAWF